MTEAVAIFTGVVVPIFAADRRCRDSDTPQRTRVRNLGILDQEKVYPFSVACPGSTASTPTGLLLQMSV
jgi:hypothetical protein